MRKSTRLHSFVEYVIVVKCKKEKLGNMLARTMLPHAIMLLTYFASYTVAYYVTHIVVLLDISVLTYRRLNLLLFDPRECSHLFLQLNIQ